MNRAWCATIAGVFGGLVLTHQSASAAILFEDATPNIGAGGFAEVVDPAASAAGLYVLGVGNSSTRYNASDPTPVIGTAFAHSEVANVYWGVGYRYLGDTHTPSTEGAIGTVSWALEARGSGPDKTAVALMLMQNGKLYRSDFQTVQTQGYEFYGQSNLTAANFGEFEGQAYDYGGTGANTAPADGRVNPLSNPDFSPTGGQIQVGYLVHFDPTLNAPDNSLTAYNLTRYFSATLNELPIPEPGTAALAGFGLIPLLSRRRRR